MLTGVDMLGLGVSVICLGTVAYFVVDSVIKRHRGDEEPRGSTSAAGPRRKRRNAKATASSRKAA